MSDTLTDLTADLVAHEPKVNETIVEALTQKTEGENVPDSGGPPNNSNPTNASTSISESSGGGFNPDIHAVDDNGNPRRKLDGTYAKKRGRKSGTAQVSGSGISSVPETKPVDFRKIGVMFSGFMFSGCQTAFGPAWEPRPQEQSQIEDAATAYCESQDISDIPPGIALILCVGMYVLPRLSDPTTKAKLRSIGESIGIVKRVPGKIPPRIPEAVDGANNGKIPVQPARNPLSQFDKA